MYKDVDEVEEHNWRNDSSLKKNIVYKRRFALLRPILCEDGTKVWLRYYYKRYIVWTTDLFDDDEYSHTDFFGNISEEEYVVRKLSEKL